MDSTCPKSSILATFLYLENLRRDGIFNASEKNVDYVLEKLNDTFAAYSKNVEKYQENSKYIVGKPINFDLITKSSLASVNFENEAEQQLPITKKQLLKTNLDINLTNTTDEIT